MFHRCLTAVCSRPVTGMFVVSLVAELGRDPGDGPADFAGDDVPGLASKVDSSSRSLTICKANLTKSRGAELRYLRFHRDIGAGAALFAECPPLPHAVLGLGEEGLILVARQQRRPGEGWNSM